MPLAHRFGVRLIISVVYDPELPQNSITSPDPFNAWQRTHHSEVLVVSHSGFLRQLWYRQGLGEKDFANLEVPQSRRSLEAYH